MVMSAFTLLMDYIYMLVKHRLWPVNAERFYDDDIQGKIAIVTGSNTGIGKATALQLAQRGAVVIMAVRNIEKGKQALEEIQEQIQKDVKIDLMKIDMGDMQSIREFVQQFQAKYHHLNILVNNASIMDTSGILKRTKDGAEQHIGTNHLGPFYLTKLLTSSLKLGAPSRIICVQSGNLALVPLELESLSKESKLKTGYFNQEQYNISKLFNSVCMLRLAKSLEGHGIKLFQVCPGLVRTSMFDGAVSGMNKVMQMMNYLTKGIVTVSPQQASEKLVFLSVARSVDEDFGKGEIYRFNVPWSKGNSILKEHDRNKETDTLYKMSEEMVGIRR